MGKEKTLYITDLDGTLLGDNARLSAYTRDTLNSLIANGLQFSFATARSIVTASRCVAGLALQGPVILDNGAIIIDYPTGKILRKASLTEAVKDKMLDFLYTREIPVMVFAIVEGQDRVSWIEGWETEAMKRYVQDRKGSMRLRPVDNLEALGAGEVIQLGFITTEEQARNLQDLCTRQGESYGFFLEEDSRHEGDWRLEIYPAGLDKGTGVAQVKELLGVDKIVAFGDNLNDLPLFAVADECYAVANAKEELKAVATGVIGSNEEDGVARWLAEHGKFLAPPRKS